MGKQINEDDCPKGLPAWLATFGDLMSLLLTFFVLLLSFASMNVTSFDSAAGALSGAMGVLSGEPQLSLPIKQALPRTEGNLSQAEVIAKAAAEVEGAVEEAGLQGDVMLDEASTGIIIRIDNKLFFDVAEAELKPESLPLLQKLGKILKAFPNLLNVQGHTDDQDINTEVYASNWELSGMRSLNVAKYFIEEVGIVPDRFRITAFSQYQPLLPNTSEDNMRQNRRVEVHILYDTQHGSTPTKIYQGLESEGLELEGRDPIMRGNSGIQPQ